MHALPVSLALATCIGLYGCADLWNRDDRIGQHPVPIHDSGHACEDFDRQGRAQLERGKGTCFTDSDCTIVGGQFGHPTCNCTQYFLTCGGIAVGTNAPGLAELRNLMQWADEAGCDTSGPAQCDCGPNTARCYGGFCYEALPTADSCFPWADAGVPDAFYPDAAQLDAP